MIFLFTCILFVLLDVLVMYLFDGIFLQPKSIPKKSVYCLVLFLAVIKIGIIYFTKYPAVNLLLSILLIATMLQIFFDGSLYKKLLTALAFLILSLVGELIPAIFIYPSTNIQSFMENPEFGAHENLLLAMVILIKLFFTFICKKAISKSAIGTSKTKTNAFLFLSIFLSSLFVALLNVFHPSPNAVALFILVIVIINFSLYTIFDRFEKDYQSEQEQQFYDKQTHDLMRYIHLAEDNVKQFKMIKHDMKNKIFSIKGYLENQEYSQALKNLDTILDDFHYDSIQFFCKDSAVNALLNLKYNTAIDSGIEVQFNIAGLEEIEHIELLDIISLFGNLLDNGIEGAKRAKQRVLFFEALHKKGTLIIILSNSTNGQVVDFRPSKENDWHGYGMKIVAGIVEQYNGYLDYSFEKEHFTLELLLIDQK